MKVFELMEQLQKEDQNMEVVVEREGYDESSFLEISRAVKIRVFDYKSLVKKFGNAAEDLLDSYREGKYIELRDMYDSEFIDYEDYEKLKSKAKECLYLMGKKP